MPTHEVIAYYYLHKHRRKLWRNSATEERPAAAGAGAASAPAPGDVSLSSADGRGPSSALGIPDDVVRLIEKRASTSIAEIAMRFAEGAVSLNQIRLQPQKSKYDPPWYFQVRHPKFSQVVAYVHPRPAELHIEYRLPASHPTYGLAVARDHFYGIVLKIQDASGLSVALQLLDDALARTD